MVSTISVSTVTAASLDSRERVRETAAERELVKEAYRYPGRPQMPLRSPLPLQGEASVGSSSSRHVVNAAAGRSKTRRVGNQNL